MAWLGPSNEDVNKPVTLLHYNMNGIDSGDPLALPFESQNNNYLHKIVPFIFFQSSPGFMITPILKGYNPVTQLFLIIIR